MNRDRSIGFEGRAGSQHVCVVSMLNLTDRAWEKGASLSRDVVLSPRALYTYVIAFEKEVKLGQMHFLFGA